MSIGPRHRLGAVLLLVALGAARAARADVAATVEPTYSNAELEIRDPTGVTHSKTELWGQKYRLTLDESPYPLLKLSAGGNLDWTLGTNTAASVVSDTDQKRWTGYGRLALGGQVLGGGLTYDRGEELSRTTTAGVSLSTPHFVRETYAANVAWQPLDLPALTLRLSRTLNYDTQRQLVNLQTNEAYVSSIYRPVQKLDLQYTLRWSDANDELRLVDQRELLNAARVSYSERLLGDRLNAYASYSIAARTTNTLVRGTGATVATQAFPTVGYSSVEAFPATPDRVTLTPNPGLIDANLDLGAGLDLGFSRSLAGDLAFRDLGAQFGNLLSTVNVVYVYVDRQLPAEVVAGFSWTVWRSDDNVTWTQVPGAGLVQFGLFQNRFEIPIQRTAARYLKVTTKPLLPAVTTDPRFEKILVTEVQFVLVVPAEEVKGRHDSTSGQLSLNAKYLIYRELNLAYDTAIVVTHATNPSQVTWSVANGLSMAKRLSPITGLSGRIDRADSDQGLGHEAVTRGSVGFTVDPLPTLGGAATYTAQLGEGLHGTSLANSVSVVAHADVYPGASLSSTAAAGVSRSERGEIARSLSASASAAVTPHPTTTLTGAYALSLSALSGGGQPSRTDRSSRVEGTVSFAPVPALFLAAGVARSVAAGAGNTLANVTASVSPFPRGDLLLRFGYSESVETAADLRLRQWGPGLRWNIRRGAHLDVSYSVTNSRTPVLETDSKAIFADLFIALR